MKNEIMCVAEDGFRPVRKHLTDAGADLRADIEEPVTLAVGESAWFPTGVRVCIPEGHFGLQAARSGLGCKHGITLANSIGVIDSGFRGEIKAKLVNLGDEPYTVNPGDRVSQLVIVPYVPAVYVQVDALPDSDRGEDGYGSTGVE